MDVCLFKISVRPTDVSLLQYMVVMFDLDLDIVKETAEENYVAKKFMMTFASALC